MSAKKAKKSAANNASASTAAKQPEAPPLTCCENIRERAFVLWEAAGCPCGDGVEFWLQAEAELSGEPNRATL